MQKILLALLLYAANTYASHPCFDVNYNTYDCSYQKQNNLGVCIKNNTGELITEQDISLWLYGENPNKTEGFGTRVLFKEFLPNAYMTIQTSTKRLKKGDQNLTNLLATLLFKKVSPTDEYGIASCMLQWSYLSPPYSKPVILNLEKVKGKYVCRYSD